MVSVEIQGWKPGFQKVATSRLLRERAGLSLAAAKRIVDQILEDKTVQINVESQALASELGHVLSEYGVGGVRIREASTVTSTHADS